MISRKSWDSRQFLYIISLVGKNRPTKIGVSRSPRNRLATIQVSHWELLKLVAIFECRTTVQAELEIHSYLQEDHIRGEWFNTDAFEVVELAKALLGEPLEGCDNMSHVNVENAH